MKLTKNFSVKEFVDEQTYKQFGDKSIWFVRPTMTNIVQKLRDRLDMALYMNTWWMEDIHPGDPLYFEFSAFRPPGCKIGASYSQHRFANALDVKVLWHATISPKEGADMLRDEITTNFALYKELGLTTIEARAFAPTWCHLDGRWTFKEDLLIVKP